ncbi:sensor histidine kinase [Candidatus Allofournierella merdipullorum]|uniref:sensor histidine kinase n=1 Tax=Candidatus Allofournierella merdipullorum TaxID=2838595 RepID=UPI002A897C7C|nr:HAMP domain-containing sensor histidine kinase [Candidatus Fournierella merdipullorum]
MDCFLPFLVVVLLAAVGLLWLKVRLLQRCARQIGKAFQDRLATDTNTLIDLPSRDPHMRRLASDINAQLRLLRSQRQRYQRGDRQVKEAVTNISHDLRTPLTAICGYLELMKQQELSPDAARYLEQIESRTLAMKGLTEELFRYSLAVSDQPPALQPMDLRRALEEALLSFYGAFAQKGIEQPELVFEEPEGRFLLDGGALGRVFGNILSNALKYSAGDLKVTLDAAGRVSFSNHAPGLDPVVVGRLFDRYYTLDTGQSSTGLGLSIARALTEEMGCAISADYADGRLTVLADFSPAREP